MKRFLALAAIFNNLNLGLGCGEGLADRIVGGDEADPNSIPWQVAMVYANSNSIRCGGTILCDKFVMTAAHCVDQGTSTSSIQIMAGEHDLLNNMDDATRHNVKAINNHPNWNGASMDYDYSILELTEPISLSGNSKARAACLPAATDTIFDQIYEKNFTVSGWGALSQGGSTSKVLHHVTVPWVSDEDCKSSYGQTTITSRMICAGNLQNGGVDSCQGDSGGPLTWVDPTTQKVKLIGVVSFGIGCAQAGYPGVYAEVSTVLSWVNQFVVNCGDSTDDPGTGTPAPTDAPSGCASPNWKGDGYCDDENNNAGCDYDGGDCCNNTKPHWDHFCTKCECLEPPPTTTPVPCENSGEYCECECERLFNQNKCHKKHVKKHCKKTCGLC